MHQIKGGFVMIKNVVVNEKVYQLNTENGIHGKTTGECYRLKVGEEDLAVKIYYKNADYLPENELAIFNKIHEKTIPILISKYPVFSESGDYIGEATPFIEEIKGKTEDILYQLPKDVIIEGLEEIQEKLPIFNQNYISLYDMGVHNMKIGKGNHLPFGIYMIDDSFHMISDLDTEFHNQQEFYRLLRSIVKLHFEKKGGLLGKEDYLDSFIEKITSLDLFYCTIPNLEKQMANYENFQEYLDDYFDTAKKKKQIY